MPRATDPRTSGGEPHVVRQRSGRLQLRRAAAGRMTKAAEHSRMLFLPIETVVAGFG